MLTCSALTLQYRKPAKQVTTAMYFLPVSHLRITTTKSVPIGHRCELADRFQQKGRGRPRSLPGCMCIMELWA